MKNKGYYALPKEQIDIDNIVENQEPTEPDPEK